MRDTRESQMRSDIKKDIRTVFGSEIGVLSLSQIAKYTGAGTSRAMEYMAGYEWTKLGRRKVFPIDSVVHRLMRDRMLSV
jgi:hypothetical protein